MNRRLFAAALLVPLAACSDLFMESERIPTALVLRDSVVTTIQGQRVRIAVTVLDQDGQPFRALPAWALPRWTTDRDTTLAPDGSDLVAVGTGQAIATVDVAGLTATARVRVNPARLQLSVAAIQLTQSAQPEGGTAPLVRGRDAMLRVFLRGDRTSFYTPEVRVRVYSGATLVQTLTAPAAEVPVELDRASLARSWNVPIPARLVQPGMRVLVEADPGNVVPRAPGSSPVYPADGVPLATDVRAVPPLMLRMIPVHQQLSGTTGNVTAANTEAYLAPLRAMFPVEQVDVDVRAPYTTGNVAVTGTGWGNILREIAALRAVDGSARHYYGVVTSGGGGIAGIGFIGLPAALGYDRLPDAAQTLAHELGHNFGRNHAPCGNPAGPDVEFPTANAALDVLGFDVQAGAVRGAAYRDLMSYCAPEWITWYTYRAILDFRGRAAPAQSAAPEPVLLVWGTVRDGEVILEPAVELTARATLPAAPGPFRIEAKDASGATLYAFSFAGAEVADGAPGERHFAFTIPQRLLQMDQLASVRLTAGGRQAAVTRAGGPVDTRVRPVAPRFSVAAPGRGRARVSWEAARHPLTVVRDPRTGDVLSFARGGDVQVRTDAPELELLFSDGVRTTSQRVRVRQP
jgi:hypothetical protein